MTSSLEVAHEKEKQQADDDLFLEKTKAQITLEAIGDCVITTDTNGKITYINPAAARLTGYSNQYAKNKPLSEIFQIRSDNSDTFITYPIMQCIKKSEVIHHESGYILKSIDGNEFTIRETASPILDKTNKVVGAVLIFHDFSNLQKMSDILAYQASHDDLTGLLNRRAFESKMHEILNEITPYEKHTLCYIDLDRFKIINDTCGHLAGDRLLKIISSEINKNIRQNDLFARLGGDEFGIIFFNCDIDKSIALAENIKSIVSNIKFSWETHAFNIGASIGIVPLMTGQNMTDLMMTVDTACYVAKDKGRNRVHVYQKNDEDILQRECELQWFQEIYKALEEDNFILYAQKITPYKNKSNHDIYEILIRLKIDNKIISPVEFIPAAERYSIMPKIDMWVIKTLFKQIKTDNILENSTYFSINLSAQTLTDNTFIDFLNKELDESLISPEKIIFEITETATISNITEATKFIRIFKDRGCKFALDDFGSGMSSFKYLGQLAIDFIKIDGDFIKDLHVNSFNQNVVKSISHIGHSLGLSIIAEYVETEEILAAIDESLIDFVQGYAIE
ncbi:MAG: EAL domain-containing protein, partial [Gammaproteobacteria bacterium]|nr:EAL domain-containing protein [Gammaproteobacteria bacterium]